MNKVATRTGTAVGSLANLRAGLANLHANIKVASSSPFLRLLQDGHWVFGQEDEELEEGSLWAINPYSLQHGIVCWTDHDQKKKKQPNEVVGECMVPMTEPVPRAEDQQDTGWPWAEQLSMTLVCVDGTQKGKEVLYNTTSDGGKRAVKELTGALMAALDEHPDTPVPIVELSSDNYQHKVHGKTYTPIIEVTEWVSLDTTELPEEQEEEEKPTRRRTRAKANSEEGAEEGEPEDDEPVKSTRVRRTRR